MGLFFFHFFSTSNISPVLEIQRQRGSLTSDENQHTSLAWFLSYDKIAICKQKSTPVWYANRGTISWFTEHYLICN